jgi:uncharacterized membrane protein YphA (DoxX/SURF4 family)
MPLQFPVDPRPILRWGWGAVQKGERLSTLPLRFGLAALFLIEGHSKLASGGRAGFQLLQQAVPGLSEPTAQALTFYGFGIGEVALGLLLLFGAFTRYACALVAVEMVLLLSLFGVPRWQVGILKDLTTLGAALSLGLTGCYLFSVDGWLRRRKPGWMI